MDNSNYLNELHQEKKDKLLQINNISKLTDEDLDYIARRYKEEKETPAADV